jgi:PadR family transcriptional regulator PadR
MVAQSLDLIRGTLDLLILQVLNHGPQHGYGIGRWLRDETGGELQIEEGALYPAMHRLENRKWVAASWGLTENNRRAKYYRLTPKGEKHLSSEVDRWTRYANAVAKILNPASRVVS